MYLTGHALYCKVGSMNDDSAAERLLVIRTLMERAAIYRRALAPIMGLLGALGSVAGALGWRYEFTHSRNQFVSSFWRERCFAVSLADPRIDIRHLNRDTVLIVFKCSRHPLFRDLMLAANWNALRVHH